MCEDGCAYHPELATLRAVSTVPPRTTSFIPSIMEEPPPPPTRGCTSDLRASMTVVGLCRERWGSQNCGTGQGEWGNVESGERERKEEGGGAHVDNGSREGLAAARENLEGRKGSGDDDMWVAESG